MFPRPVRLGVPLSSSSSSSSPVKLETRGITSHHSDFWDTAWMHWSSVITRLDETGHSNLVGKMRSCHQDETRLTCMDCGKGKQFTNRCEIRWCPLCAPRLARERSEELTAWARTLKQPKHVVLTIRNTDTLRRRTVRNFQRALARLRRMKFAKWTAGTWSLETTNESRGWHLHAHLLVEARWIDSGLLSAAWAKQVRQDFAIVKVKDARAKEYLAEVAKYVVKSSDLASWHGEDIAQLMVAFKGLRSFGVFGTLCGQRKVWRLTVRQARSERNKCECGCRKFQFDGDARLAELEHAHRRQLQRR